MINIENPDFAGLPSLDSCPRFPYRPAEAVLQPVVSVITPYYNTDEVFAETARSLLDQSFQEWEWVIVNDGSTDPSALARLDAIEKSDPRIKVVNQTNRGPAAARNTAFRNSRGRYICLLDSDDLLEPTFIEKCIWFLESQTEFGFCNSWSVSFGSEEFLWAKGFERGKDYLKANLGPNISVIRRTAFEACGGFDETILFGHEDWDFWLALANAGYWGHTLPEYLEWYRKRSSGRYYRVMNSASTHSDFKAFIARKYAGLEARFPSPQLESREPSEITRTTLPFGNRLAKSDNVRRILFVVPWMITRGGDEANLGWIEGLIENGYQVSVCATFQSHHNGLHKFARLTPDIFTLPNFLPQADFPHFLVYLIRSRQIDTALVAGNIIGYELLPYLRIHCPGTTFVDLCQVKTWSGKLEEDKQWLAGQNEQSQKDREKRDAVIADQKAWIGKLEEDKQWLAGQNELLRQEIHKIQRSRLWRILNALRSIFGSHR